MGVFDDSAQERTEKPTPRKRERSRQEGMAAQSTEVEHAVVLVAGLGTLWLFGSGMLSALIQEMSDRLGHLHSVVLTPASLQTVTSDSFLTMARAAGPIMACVALAGLLGSLAQTGVMFTTKRLAPNLEYLNPAKGVKQLFSGKAVVKMIIAIIKLAVIILIVYLFMSSREGWFYGAFGRSPWGVMDMGRTLVGGLLARITMAMILIAALDYAWERWRFEKQLMMTRSEMKEEFKRDDGDPLTRARRDRQRRSIVRARMMQAVPTADVVVANPTHVAVALRWDDKEMDAPEVVAKGRRLAGPAHKDHRTRARRARPGAPPLAHALYETVEVGVQIPPKLYYAVAEVLAFVMRRKGA